MNNSIYEVLTNPYLPREKMAKMDIFANLNQFMREPDVIRVQQKKVQELSRKF